MKHFESKRLIKLLSTIAFVLTLQACASGLSVPPTCPQPPQLPARVPMGPSFQDLMQSFLAGSLPELTPSEQDLLPATK